MYNTKLLEQGSSHAMHDFDLVPIRPAVKLDDSAPAFQGVDDGDGTAVAIQLVARQVRVVSSIDLHVQKTCPFVAGSILLRRRLVDGLMEGRVILRVICRFSSLTHCCRLIPHFVGSS